MSRPTLATLVLTIVTLLACSPDVRAQTYWNGTNSGVATGPVTGGTGTWTADGNTVWTNQSGTENDPWGDSNGTGTLAIFTVVNPLSNATGTYTVTLLNQVRGSQPATHIFATQLTFQTGGYNLIAPGGQLNMYGDNIIEVDQGAANLNLTLSATNVLNKTGVGQLVLTGSNALAGVTLVNGSIMASNGTAGSLGGATSSVVLETGTGFQNYLDINGVGSGSRTTNFGSNISVTGTGEMLLISDLGSSGAGVSNTFGTLSLNNNILVNQNNGFNTASGTTTLTFGATTIAGANAGVLSVALSGTNLVTLGSVVGSAGLTSTTNFIVGGNNFVTVTGTTNLGAGNLVKFNTGSLLLTGSVVTTGTIDIVQDNGGLVTLLGTESGSTVIVQGGRLVLGSSTTGATNFITDGATVILRGGALYAAGLSANQSETMGTLMLGTGDNETGNNSLAGSAQNFVFTNYFTRQTGGALDVTITGTANGTTSGNGNVQFSTNQSANLVNGIIGGWATTGNDFATLNTTGTTGPGGVLGTLVQALGSTNGGTYTVTGSTDFTAAAAAASGTANILASTLAGGPYTTLASGTGTIVINSLNLQVSALAANSSGLNLGGNTLDILSGGFLIKGNGATAPTYTIMNGNLTAGNGVAGATPAELFIESNTGARYSIATTISDNGSASVATVYTGNNSNPLNSTGAVTFVDGANTYTGGTYIEQGTVWLSSDRALGAIPTTASGTNIVISNGASLQIPNLLPMQIANNRGIFLSGGGGAIQIINGMGPFVLANTISGTGALNFSLSQNTIRMTLSGSNTYDGTTNFGIGSSGGNQTVFFTSIGNINGGASALGDPTTAANGVITFSGNTPALFYNGTGTSTTDREFRENVGNVASFGSDGGALILNGNIVNLSTSGAQSVRFNGYGITVMNGNVAQETANPINLNANLAGGGIVQLNGQSTYTGSTTVTSGVLEFNNIGNVGSGPSSLGNVSSVAAGTIQFAGGTLRFIGNNAQSTDRVLNLATNTTTSILETTGSAPITFVGGVTNSEVNNTTHTLQLGGTGTGFFSGTGSINNNITSGLNANKFLTALTVQDIAGQGNWVLNQSVVNSYSGGTTVNSGQLTLDFSNLAAANSLVGNNLIGTTLTMGGGILNIQGAAGDVINENMRSLSLTGSTGSQINVDPNNTVGAGSTALNLGSTIAARPSGATLNINLGTNSTVGLMTTQLTGSFNTAVAAGGTTGFINYATINGTKFASVTGSTASTGTIAAAATLGNVGNASTATFTTSLTNLVNGEAVTLGTAPTGFTAGSTYYVVNYTSGASFGLANTPGGAAIAATSSVTTMALFTANMTSTTNFVVGQAVNFGATVPTGFAANTIYYVVSASSGTYTFSSDPGGAPIVATPAAAVNAAFVTQSLNVGAFTNYTGTMVTAPGTGSATGVYNLVGGGTQTGSTTFYGLVITATAANQSLDLGAFRMGGTGNANAIVFDGTGAGDSGYTIMSTGGAGLLGTAGQELIISTAGTNALTISALLGNTTGTFDKAGTGTLILSGANNYFGPTNVEVGNLQAGSNVGFSPNSVVNVTNSGVLSVAGNTAGVLALIGNGTVQNGAATSGTLVIGAANTNSGAGFTAGSSSFTGIIQDGSLTGSLSLVKAGYGQENLANAAYDALNTYTGQTTILNGVLGVYSIADSGLNSSLGQGTTINIGSYDNLATLQFEDVLSANQETNRSIVLAANGADALDVVGQGNVLGTNGYNSENGDFAGGLVTLTGDITGGGTLLKLGTGNLDLRGTNSYTGGTVVDQGLLRFGTASSVPTTGLITINYQGTVGFGFNFNQTLVNNSINPLSTGVLALGADDSNNLDFTNYGGLALGALGHFTYTGTLTPNATVGYQLGGGGYDQIAGGPPAGPNSLLTLANQNALTGANNVTITPHGTAGAGVVIEDTQNFTGTMTIGGGINAALVNTSVFPNSGDGYNNAGAAWMAAATFYMEGGATMSGVSDITLNPMGQLVMVATANSLNRINDSAPIDFNGGALSFMNDNTNGAGNLSTSYSETLGALNLNRGYSEVFVAGVLQGSGTTTVSNVTFNSLNRTNGATILFSGGGLGQTGTTVSTITFVNTPSTSGLIATPWAFVGGGSGLGFSDEASDFAIIAPGTNGMVKAANGTTISGSNTTGTPFAGNADWTILNMSINGTSSTLQTMTLSGNNSANTIRYGNSVTVGTQVIDPGTGTFAVNGILNGSASNAGDTITFGTGTSGTVVGTGTVTSNAQTSAASEIVMNAGGNSGSGSSGIAINENLNNNANGSVVTLIKTGNGDVTLNGTTSNYSGGIVVDGEGALRINGTGTGNFGGVGTNITLNSGSVVIGGLGTSTTLTNNWIVNSDAVIMDSGGNANNFYTGNITVNNGTLYLIQNNGSATNHQWDGTISGTGNMAFQGATSTVTQGITIAGNTVNTLSGTTYIEGRQDGGAATVVDLEKTGSGIAISGSIVLGNSTAAGNNGSGQQQEILILDASNSTGMSGNQIADSSIIYFQGGNGLDAGVFRLNNQSETIGGIQSMTAGDGIIENNSNTAGSGTLTLNMGSNNETFSGLILNHDNSNTGGLGLLALVKNGSGTLTLSNTNTFSGGFTINQGTVNAGLNGSLVGTLGALIINNNNTGAGTNVVVNLATAQTSTIGSLSGSMATASSGTNTVTLNNNGQTLTVNQTASGTYSGVITGAGGLTLGPLGTAGSTLTLIGTNTYTGTTTIIAGTLQLGSGTGSGFINALPISITGTAGGLAIDEANGTVFNTVITVNNGTVIGAESGNITNTIASNISGSGGFLQSGTGTTILTGSNSYLGSNVVTQGTLIVGTGSSLGSATGSLIVSNTNTGAGSSVLLDLSTTQSTTTGALSGSIATPSSGTNTATIDNGGQAFTVNQTVSGTYAGAIVGAGSLTMSGSSGANTLTLTGSSTYSGATTVVTGTLQVGNGVSGSIGSGAITLSGSTSGLVVNEANGANQSNAITDNGLVTGNESAAVTNTLSGAISGNGSFLQNGAGTTILSGADTYTGSTAITAGTLQLGDGTNGSINSNPISMTGATSALAVNEGNAAVITNTITDSGTVIGAENAGVTNTLSGGISGAGGFLQRGFGTTILSGSDTYTGVTNVTAGLLKVTGTLTSATGTTNLSGTGTLYVAGTVTGSVNIASGATLGGIGKTGNVALAAGGKINNADGLIGKLTVGNLTLNGGSLTFDIGAGTTNNLDSIAAGTLTLNAGTNTINIGALTGTTVMSTGTYVLISDTSKSGSGTFVLGNSFVNGAALNLVFVGNNLELGVIAGAGPTSPSYTLVASTNGVTALHAGGTVTVTSTITNSGTGSQDALNSTSLGIASTAPTMNDTATATGTLNRGASATNTGSYTAGSTGTSVTFTATTTPTPTGTSAGAGTLTGSTTASVVVYTGQSTWATGTSGTWGSISGTQTSWNATGGTPGLDSNFQTTDSATFSAGSSPVLVSLQGDNPSLNNITFGESGAGTGYTLQQGSTGTGTITLNNGSSTATIQDVGTGGASNVISAPMNFTSNVKTTIAGTDSLAITGKITGAGSLSNGLTNSGTLILSGANTYSGGTTISSGTLVVNNTTGSAVGSGAFILQSGGFLTGTGTINTTAANTLSGTITPGSGGLASTGTLTVASSVSETFAGSSLTFNLSTTSLGQSNSINLLNTPSVSFGSGVTNLTFNLVGGGAPIADGTKYVLFLGDNVSGQYADLTQVGGQITNFNVMFNGTTAGLPNGSYYGQSFIFEDANGNIDIEIVPEPGTWVLMLGGLALLLVYQRVRRSKDS